MITDLVNEFNLLTQQMLAFRQHLMNSRPAHYFPLKGHEQEISSDPLTHACDLLTDLWYRGNQDGRETRTRHGLLLADEQTIDLINAINNQKDNFRTAVNAEKQRLDKEQWRQREQQLGEIASPLRDSLTYSGLRRVHLKQCYRHIPLLADKPTKVGFSWYTNGRSIKKISHQQAQQLLIDLGEDKPHIQVQLQTLANLTADTQLARVQALAPSVRANLVFEREHITSRKAMNSSLPIFITTKHDNDSELPIFNIIELAPPNGRSRLSRNDNQISETPILPSIRAFTYTK